MNANVLPFNTNVTNLNGGNLMTASHQWRTRPDDQRFVSLLELDAHCRSQRLRSAGKVLPSKAIQARPLQDDINGLVMVGPDGSPVQATNWSFGQLASRSGAPAGYLRKLPAPLAADCINYGLHVERDVEDLGVLLERPATNGIPTLRAVTGPNYGRIWNSQVTQALVERFGDGLTGDFRIPGEFGERVPITKKNTTLYASDRDMFVFLADEHNRIDVPNRRNGATGSLARGFFVWNSEVGSTSWGIALFLFDYVCMNRIIWGVHEVVEVRGRHTSSAPDKWLHQVAPMLHQYANSSAAPVQAAIASAQKKRIDDVDGFLRQRFTAGVAEAVKLAHFTDEQRPIESLWDAATGITAYARTIEHQDERVAVERVAGKILNLAA